MSVSDQALHLAELIGELLLLGALGSVETDCIFAYVQLISLEATTLGLEIAEIVVTGFYTAG